MLKNPTLLKSIVKKSSPLQIQDIMLNDQKQYFTFSPLKGYPYSIAAFVPESRFLQPVNQLQTQFFIWVLFTIASVLFLGYLFRKKCFTLLNNLHK
ncbi:hypothetical protein [Tepidibacillus marianensis]|uniref:hypothetical protein n=1 Tax=Tepidibacillus marianensis TaxID=3131995 RepID=UPI0030CEACE2